MSRSVLVNRVGLGLDNLQLWEQGKFYLPDGTFGGGETTQRRGTSESPMVKGRYAYSIVEGQRQGVLAVHVVAPDVSALQARVQEVVTALTQFRFTLAWQWNGLSGTWQCEAADWALGQSGVLDEEWLAGDQQAVFFTVPHRRVSGF